MTKPTRNKYDYQARLILDAVRHIPSARLSHDARELTVGTGVLARTVGIALATDDGSILSSRDIALLEALIEESYVEFDAACAAVRASA